MRVQQLVHGGIMVNYRCNAACRHCLYACSPERRAGYISKEKIREVCHLLVKGRIGSVHIGGGEPFLDFEGLVAVIRELAEAGIALDYIETNAFWANEPFRAGYLKTLKREGVKALCISVDPFHAEYVPWENPVNLARFCGEIGMDCFLWKREFLKPLSRLPGGKRLSRPELEAALSPSYIADTARAYGIRLGGRAVNIEEEYGPRLPAAALLDDEPCGGLLSSGHFHVDLEGFFIPPGCVGLRLPLEELIGGISAGKYPIFEVLYARGIAGLYQFAQERGFSPDEKGYPSKCNLCFHIRKILGAQNFAELDEDFYRESLKRY